MTDVHTGWLFDAYPNGKNLTLWMLCEDGQRRHFVQDFPVAFYAAGAPRRLRELWKWLEAQEVPVRLSRKERRDAFRGMITVLSVEVLEPARLDALFHRAASSLPDLTYYDGDIPLALRHAAAFGVFPLARCRLESRGETALDIVPLDTPWKLDPEPAPLRVLSLEPDCDPARGEPGRVLIACEGARYSQPLQPARPLLVNLSAVLRRCDPDLVLTTWGDTWLMAYLLELSRQVGVCLPLNRDEGEEVVVRREHTYFSYGQIVYRGRQIQLRGRWHLDRHNATLWNDYGLDGVLEMARVTGQPVQEAARLSPGTGISSMQFITALRQGILIPWHKHQAEAPKTALGLLQADMGGMVYQPMVGLHRDAAGIDFVSMYPGIMVRFNISPEVPRAGMDLEPASGEPGIVPLTLAPLLQKRLAFKRALVTLARHDCRRPAYQARASAAKWLLVTCFGYLGYKNARFGRIEAHEAVTAYGREALLRAKEAAEDMDFEVLHMYVDGLWVRREGCGSAVDFEALLNEIAERTGLPIALDGMYRWVVFLPSRLDGRVPVPNRYFGVFQDGSIKVRGIECRRRDTPPFIADVQMTLLQILAGAPDADHLSGALSEAQVFIRRSACELRAGRVLPEQLLVSQKLSRELGEYSSPSPAARAVRQMQAAGKDVRPGQRVRFLYTRGRPGVRAWDLPAPPDPRTVDLPRYRTLLLRAAQTVLAPIQQSLEAGQGYPGSENLFGFKVKSGLESDLSGR